MPMLKFTVLVENKMLGTSRYIGTFESEEAARTYRDEQAARSRSFASFEIWTGTPDRPGKPIEGSRVTGKH